IELLFVYSDNGQTDGTERIENREFYERLAQETALFIEAKREGIFQVDLRLRPFGQAGPKACSLETFCRYYGPGGKAMSYERLALVRLRAVGGDAELGARVERLRDELLYASGVALDLEELRDLRERQIKEKTAAGRPNAKFSPGALVDLEYAVQIMQVAKGREFPALRTPRIHEALAALSDAGVLERGEAESLAQAYDLLRRLINGLRMLRGSAKDLFLPPLDSAEYAHLARRMGYEREEGLTPAQKLHMDFDTRTAAVRAFLERHFGRGATPGPEGGNVADLALTDQAPDSLKQKILTQAGFRNWKRAYVNLRSLARLEGGGEEFARLAVLACDILRRRPDPDMALNNWERFARSLANPGKHFQGLMNQPMRLEILMDIFSGSQFLSDTLARNPEFLDWLTVAGRLRQVRRRGEMEADLRSAALAERGEWRNHLRRLRRREALRIGTRDICLGMPMQEIVGEISELAEAAVSVTLDRLWVAMEAEGARLRPMAELRDRFCVVALGKLGGAELNYSSDIDLVGVFDDTGADADSGLAEFFSGVMEQLRADLSQHTEEGYAYRVDLRLRPYGSAGLLAWGLGAIMAYYGGNAAAWELQALLKARPIAGSARLGEAFTAASRPLLLGAAARGDVVASIERMRGEQLKAQGRGGMDVKTGMGGLRDVEFLVQGLQLMRAPERPELLEGNTLKALKGLVQAGALPANAGDELREDYVFLRRVEHCLQIFEDRQVHALPEDAEELAALARRMMGVEATAEAFQARLAEVSGRVRRNYERYLLGKGQAV
ncbi:MAG TPA: glutamate-ammonia-ligase adenylyltransferase, partial [Candidatus Brocadiia bacterium]|nr:glutamate-ammonia-ligase adenylyltransferase [Candidatus Brocadiia bacterium]